MLPALTLTSFKAMDVTLKYAVSHLSGIPILFPIILLSEISQPDYVHVITCNNFQIMNQNANIDETRYFVRSIPV